MSEAPDEPVDIDLDRRRYIVDVFARLETSSHYELLGLASDADKKAVKRAYFELVRTMHPDRYFGKRLGSYRAKMEAIFERMTESYEVLSDSERRAAYDAVRGISRRSSRPLGSNQPVDPTVLAERQAAMDALKARFSDAKRKAAEHASAAARARASGDLVAATTAYEAALALTPGDPTLQAAFAEVQREATARLAESHRKKAQLEERWGRWTEAAESWRVVVDAHPDDGDARAKLGAALARARSQG